MPVKPTTVTCPICRSAASFSAANVFRPFCSERCQLIDLGEWLNEERRIVGGKVADDSASTAATDEPDAFN